MHECADAILKDLIKRPVGKSAVVAMCVAILLGGCDGKLDAGAGIGVYPLLHERSNSAYPWDKGECLDRRMICRILPWPTFFHGERGQ